MDLHSWTFPMFIFELDFINQLPEALAAYFLGLYDDLTAFELYKASQALMAVANTLLWLCKVVVTSSTSMLAVYECTDGNAVVAAESSVCLEDGPTLRTELKKKGTEVK